MVIKLNDNQLESSEIKRKFVRKTKKTFYKFMNQFR